MPEINPGLLEQKIRQTLSHAKLRLTRLPDCPELSLYLYDPDVLEGPISHEEAQAVVADPAYWSFCWASGQVLASYLLEHPQLVSGNSVLDVGCGSGVVGIAAARAGAREVTLCDNDADALMAAQLNSNVNRVAVNLLEDVEALEKNVDTIVAADILYDRDNFGLLKKLKGRCERIILADSRVKTLPEDGFVQVDCRSAHTCPDLNEFEEFNQVRIYIWKKPS